MKPRQTKEGRRKREPVDRLLITQVDCRALSLCNINVNVNVKPVRWLPFVVMQGFLLHKLRRALADLRNSELSIAWLSRRSCGIELIYFWRVALPSA